MDKKLNTKSHQVLYIALNSMLLEKPMLFS